MIELIDLNMTDVIVCLLGRFDVRIERVQLKFLVFHLSQRKRFQLQDLSMQLANILSLEVCKNVVYDWLQSLKVWVHRE
jgi:hypothetical protein